MPFGAGMRFGAQHSQTLYSIFAHVPGPKVVVPSIPYDAKGLLVEAIGDNNSLYFEHRMLCGLRGDVPQNGYAVSFSEANVINEGTDVTVVSCALMLYKAIEAEKQLQKGRIR